jgi:hypothetical protein
MRISPPTMLRPGCRFSASDKVVSVALQVVAADDDTADGIVTTQLAAPRPAHLDLLRRGRVIARCGGETQGKKGDGSQEGKTHDVVDRKLESGQRSARPGGATPACDGCLFPWDERGRSGWGRLLYFAN